MKKETKAEKNIPTAKASEKRDVPFNTEHKARKMKRTQETESEPVKRLRVVASRLSFI